MRTKKESKNWKFGTSKIFKLYRELEKKDLYKRYIHKNRLKRIKHIPIMSNRCLLHKPSKQIRLDRLEW